MIYYLVTSSALFFILGLAWERKTWLDFSCKTALFAVALASSWIKISPRASMANLEEGSNAEVNR